MHFTYIHNGQNTKQKENGNYMYHNYIYMMTKRVNFISFFFSNLRTLNESLQTFIQVVREPAYISTIISTAADEGPHETMYFPAGLHYLFTFQTRMSKINRKRCVFMRTFPRKDVFISPYIRENEWIV